MKTKLEQNKDYYEKNKEHLRADANKRYAKNKEKMNERRRAWYANNKNRQLQTHTVWVEKNRGKINAYSMNRFAIKKQRTPSWLTDIDLWIMEEIYDLAAKRTVVTGIKWEVDHIVPLQGKTVSGLHVPWNLQVVPIQYNRQKYNKFYIGN
jgi:5-methylcytosine-specific restriction endonuclease McrA